MLVFSIGIRHYVKVNSISISMYEYAGRVVEIWGQPVGNIIPLL